MVAVALALASALVVAWGTVARHRVVLGQRGAILSTALRSPLWWLGAAAAIVAYLLQLAALHFGTVLIVQPILVLSLLFTLVVAAMWAKAHIDTGESAWALVLGASVAVLVLVGRPQAGETDLWFADWAPWLAGGVVVVAVLVAVGVVKQKALCWGAATGVIYGYVAPVAKAAVDAGTLAAWEPWVLVALIVAGAVLQQYAFGAGPLEESLPAMTVAEPIVAMTVGYALLGETFAVSGVFGWAVIALAAVGMLGATWALSVRSVR